MGVYQNGTSIIIDETFYIETVPGDFSTAVPTDPTTVTFYTRDPDGNLTTYVFGVDTEVTNPSVGNYILSLDASVLALGGEWFYRVQGSGAVVAAAEGEFSIEASSVLTPVVTAPQLQPCQFWCDPQDVAAYGDTGVGSDWSVLLPACQSATEILNELSARQFGGVCPPITYRPCSDGCGCWNWLTWPMSPGAPQVNYSWGGWGGYGWGWGYDGCSAVCGCGPLSRAVLPGYPVIEIVEVKIDGVILAEDQYRLDDWRYLTRMADPVTNAPQFWPGCQRLDLPDGQPGTWSVKARAGMVPPLSGRLAATQLAFQLWRAMNGQKCELPAGVTSINRTGITVQRAPFTAWGLRNGSWATGLSLVDAFLSAFNPSGLTRDTTIWSPDMQEFSVMLG